jgi:hypothetical protein
MNGLQYQLFQKLKDMERIDDLGREETKAQVRNLYQTMLPMVNAQHKHLGIQLDRPTPLRGWLNPFSVSRIEVAKRCGGQPLPINLRLALERNWASHYVLTQFYQ